MQPNMLSVVILVSNVSVRHGTNCICKMHFISKPGTVFWPCLSCSADPEICSLEHGDGIHSSELRLKEENMLLWWVIVSMAELWGGYHSWPLTLNHAMLSTDIGEALDPILQHTVSPSTCPWQMIFGRRM